MIYTTLNELHSFLPTHWCMELLAHLDKTKFDDEPLPLVTVLDRMGLADTLPCLRVCPDVAVEFAQWCTKDAARDSYGTYLPHYTRAAERGAARAAAMGAMWAFSRVADWPSGADELTSARATAAGAVGHQIAKLRELLS